MSYELTIFCIKIIDFGFANVMKNDVLLETFCGSAAYSSPEMVMN